MKAARLAWFEGQPDLDPERLVFIDETAATTNMVRRYARAPRGQRCRIAVPQGHYKTIPVTAALRASGPLAIDLKHGATTGAHFRSYVANTLAPLLEPGDVVIMDNLRPQGDGRARGARKGRRPTVLPAVLQSRLQSLYGWLLRVKLLGSGLTNWSAAAMYTASADAAYRCAP